MYYTAKHLTVNSFSVFVEVMGEWHKTHYQCIIQAYKGESWGATGRPNHCRTSHFDNEIGFFQGVFAEKPSPSCTLFSIDLSGWKVLIWSEILIKVSSDK